MKKTLLALATAALVACAGKAISSSDLVGNYDAEITLPEAAKKDDAAMQMATALLSQIKMEMNFKADGTVDMTTYAGEESASEEGKWTIKADSLFIVTENKTQSFKLEKKGNGFKLDTDKEVGFVLTKK